MKRWIVIGAGLQGCSIALALASRNIPTLLIDTAPAVMCGTSLVNEGKIHLGFVYAMDHTGKTRELMLRGALNFSPLLDRWCGPLPWDSMVSKPFEYGVMPDSLLSPDEIERKYQELEEQLESLDVKHHRYLGTRPTSLFERIPVTPHHPQIMGQSLAGLFLTAERSVDPRLLAQTIRKAVKDSEQIEVSCDTKVTECYLDDKEVVVRLHQPHGPTELRAERVINCTWEDGERLDRGIGLPKQELNYRVKHQVLVKPKNIREICSPTTFVQGPYGDIVPWNDGQVYLSWYPTGRTYFGANPPPHMPSENQRQDVAKKTLEIMSEMFPALNGAEITSCKAGVIIGHGMQDVDSPHSGLHQRDGLGIRHLGRWTSINPGKLTTAPLYAEQFVQQLLQEPALA